jgi:hypothetical protein
MLEDDLLKSQISSGILRRNSYSRTNGKSTSNFNSLNNSLYSFSQDCGSSPALCNIEFELENHPLILKRKELRFSEKEVEKKMWELKQQTSYDRDDDHLSLFISILSPFKFYDDEKYRKILLKRLELKKSNINFVSPISFSFSQICSLLFPSGFLQSGFWSRDLFKFHFLTSDDTNPPLSQNMLVTAYTQTLQSNNFNSLNVNPQNYSNSLPSLLSYLSFPYPATSLSTFNVPPENPFCCLRRGLCRIYNPISHLFFYFISLILNMNMFLFL